MSRIRFKFLEATRSTKIRIALVLLTLATLGVSVWLAGPSPPRKIVLATGQEGGGYDTFGNQYRSRLRKMGLEVELVNTNGSIDNLQRLVDGEADVAFVQAGTYPLVEDPGHRLRGLAAVYLEPLWVFYRGSSPAHALSDLKGWPLPPAVAATITVGLLGGPGGAGPLLAYSTLVTGRIPTISVGPERSGTEAVARLLLKAHGITGKNARIINLDTVEAQQGLKDGSVEVALKSIKVPVLYMPSETDLYFPLTDARYEAAFIHGVELKPIPSLWGHTAGAAPDPADAKFLNDEISRFMALQIIYETY